MPAGQWQAQRRSGWRVVAASAWRRRRPAAGAERHARTSSSKRWRKRAWVLLMLDMVGVTRRVARRRLPRERVFASRRVLGSGREPRPREDTRADFEPEFEMAVARGGRVWVSSAAKQTSRARARRRGGGGDERGVAGCRRETRSIDHVESRQRRPPGGARPATNRLE